MSRFYVSIHVQTKRDIASAMAGGERGEKVDLGTWVPQELAEHEGSHRSWHCQDKEIPRNRTEIGGDLRETEMPELWSKTEDREQP